MISDMWRYINSGCVTEDDFAKFVELVWTIGYNTALENVEHDVEVSMKTVEPEFDNLLRISNGPIQH